MGFRLDHELEFEQEEIFVNGYKTNYRFFVCNYMENSLYFVHKNKIVFS